MSARRFVVILIFILFVSIVITGCASPTPALTPSACPTSELLICPTAFAQVGSTPNAWRMDYSHMINISIIFDPGDKCSIDVKNLVTYARWSYEIVVNDQTYQNYMVVALTVEAGKTLKDLEEHFKATSSNNNPPPWATTRLLVIVDPLSRTYQWVTFTGDPLYFACLVQGPGDPRVIDAFGPVEIVR